MLSSHRSVLGYLVLSRGHPVSIIRQSGVVFEGEQGRRYASAVARIVEGVQSALVEASGEENEGVRVSNSMDMAAQHEHVCRMTFVSCGFALNGMNL